MNLLFNIRFLDRLGRHSQEPKSDCNRPTERRRLADSETTTKQD